MSISELIKKYRKLRNESVNSLAKALNVTPSTLNRIENGETKKIDFQFVTACISYLKIPKLEVLYLMSEGERFMVVAELIRSKRMEKGYSLEDVSKQTGLSIAELHDIEEGRVRDISFRLISKFKFILSITEEEINEAIQYTFMNCNKIENMEIRTASGRCNVCNFDYDIKDICLGGNNQLSVVSLCKDCREKLASMLVK